MIVKRNGNKNDLNYNLSENSKKSIEDFKTANRLASIIYAVFKKLLKRSASRNQYQRLSKLIIKVMHSGAPEFLGIRKLHQGNIGLLKGFRLNPYTLWDSIIHFQPVIAISPEDQTVCIHLPAVNAKDVVVPARASKLVLQFACCEVDADNNKLDTHLSAKLILPLKQGDQISNAKKMTMHLPDMEGKVLLIILIIQMYLQEGYKEDMGYSPAEFLSNDRKYYAGEILEASYVKDGQLVKYNGSTTDKMKEIDELNNWEEVTWEDD